MKKRFLTLTSLVFAVGFFAAGILLSAKAGNFTDNSVRTLSVEERVAYQRKIEEVYWQRRLWSSSQPKPKLEEVLPLAVIQTKVEDGLRKSNALEKIFNRSVSTEQLRAEVERMAQQTRNAEMLGELFAALDNDSFLIAEILARPALTETFLKDAYFTDARFQPEGKKDAGAESENLRDEAAFESWWQEHKNEFGTETGGLAQPFELPAIAPAADDSWAPMVAPPIGGTDVSAVWTGVEVIIWNSNTYGSRYNPALDMTFPISRTNAPPMRTTHTAVWTGQEMIIWGGHNGASDVFRAGFRYNPTTDTWTQTSTVNAPEARDAHVSVWTGTEMIVWGGWNPAGVNLNSGGRYNPANDTWTPTSQTNAPPGRLRASAVWTGQEMIIWGGTISNVGAQNTGGRYNPSTDTWTLTSTTNAPSPRFAHTAVWTGTEMIVWGGGANGVAVNTGGRYNPSNDSWSSMAVPALEPRRFHTAVWTGTEMIVWGGCIDVQCSVSREDGSRYNPSTDTWTPTAQVVGNNRSRHAAVWTGTEMIVAGGCRGGQCNQRVTNIVRYNPSTNSWREARYEPIATPRQPVKSVWTGTEMLVWGVDAELLDNYVYRFNPTMNRWTQSLAAGAPDARSDFSLVWTGMEMIVWGGDVQGLGLTRTGGRYNPMTDSWTQTNINGAPSARILHEAVWAGTEMIVWGGSQGSGTFNSGARYNPSTDTWTPTSTTNAPTGRVFHTIIWSGTEMIVWGGSNLTASNNFNTGGRYNPATNTWTATSTANAPAARNSHTAVWTGAEMIVWGGKASTALFNTGGRYNPSNDTWTPTDTATAPNTRWLHTAVWTGTEMIVWGGLVNGDFPFQSTNTGSRYNPSTDSWRATTLVGAPDQRNAHTAVWTGSQMIVWGGARDPESIHANTGAIYNPETNEPPTPTPTPTPTPDSTPTPVPSPTPSPTSFPSPTPTPSNSAGSLDPSFGIQGKQVILTPNINEPGGLVWNPPGDLAFQPDGKILVGGSAYNTFDGFDFTVTRFNTDGSLDSSFANNGVFRYDFAGNDDVGLGIALQPDGKIILAGEVYLGVFNNQVDTAFGIIRLNPNGTLDSTFGTGGGVTTNFFSSLDAATEVALQPDGKIIATGYVTQGGVNNGSTYDFALVRYNPDGSLDPTFGSGGKVTTDFNGLGDRAQTSVLQPDGKIVLAGWVYGTTVAAQIDFGLARYNTDGSLDTTFDGDGKVVTTFGTNLDELARGMALAPDGKIVVAGDLYNPPPVIGQSGHRDVAAARYNTDGSLDTSFDGDGRFIYDSNLTDRNEDADDVVVQPDGKILLVGGSHLIVNAVPGVSDKDMMLIRLNVNGSFDNSFGNNGIVLTDFGIFNQPGPPEFGSGRTGDTTLRAAIGLQPDGKIVATCDTTFRRAHHRLAIARYLNDTPIPNPAVSGRIIYANAQTNVAVPFATLSAAGSIPLSAMTNSNGDYSMSGFGSGAYTVTPSKTGQVNGISNLDASRVAQHIVGLAELNEFQILAADTSGNGTIGALDAAYIAQYVASISNPGQTGMWKFLPSSRSYANMQNSQSNQNFSAILVGDVTGNWDPSINNTETGGRLEQSRQQTINKGKTAAVEVTTHAWIEGEKAAGLTVELRAKDTTGAGILGYQFDVHYDAALVTPQIQACDVSETVSREMTAVCNISQPGVLKVVVFGITPLSGEGALLKLKFDPIRIQSSASGVKVTNFIFNEDAPLKEID